MDMGRCSRKPAVIRHFTYLASTMAATHQGSGIAMTSSTPACLALWFLVEYDRTGHEIIDERSHGLALPAVSCLLDRYKTSPVTRHEHSYPFFLTSSFTCKSL